jgi:hypothetical protein
LATGTAHASRTLRTIFVRGNFSVTVLVEFLQRLRGLGQFVGVDRAVLVRVEGFNDGLNDARPHPGSTGTARATRATRTTRTAWAARSTRGLALARRAWGVLGWQQASGGAERHREKEDFGFHAFFFFIGLDQGATIDRCVRFGSVWFDLVSSGQVCVIDQIRSDAAQSVFKRTIAETTLSPH